MEWRRSSYCGTDHVTEQCVEVRVIDNRVQFKDSEGMITQFTRDEMKAFTDGVKAGEFDDLT